jgi:ATP-dependent helicase/nuclease subunit A
MSAPVDQQSRDRIGRLGLAETLFVDAGAGTGKTSTLVERIVQLVVTEQVPLREIAAITFTEAAAAELRDRVRRALDDASRDADTILAARAATALDEFDIAAISTLHAFAQRLLREHPIEVSIPPRVEVLDEVQSQLAFDDRWAAHVARWQTDPDFVPLVVRLWSLGIELRRSYGPSLKDVAAILDDNWDRLEEHEATPRRAPRPVDRTPLLAAIRDLRSVCVECHDISDKFYARIQGLLPIMDEVGASFPDDDEQYLTQLATCSTWTVGQGGAKSKWVDLAAAKETFRAVAGAAGAVVATAIDDVLSIWGGILHEVTLAAAHERRDAGQLEFHDLLVLARRLLRTSSEARRAVHQRYTRLLLDEFQDTDPIQVELALRIASDPAASATDWRDLTPQPGRVFFVGDPKQSIYRFRRADIALFHEARDHVGAAAQVSLVQNFRTVEPIVSWVNAVFGALMPEETRSSPRYRPLTAYRMPSGTTDHRVVMLGQVHADDPAAAELRRREAVDVAAAIDAIRADPWSRPVGERGPDGTTVWRAACCADITVLIPSRTSLSLLEAALAAADVPYRIDTSTLVFDAPEIRDLLAVLGAVDDPADAIAVVAALRSPVLACSDVDLFDWVQGGGTFDYRRADLVPVGAPAAVVEAIGALASWHADARWCEPATLLERIVRERDVYALALSERRPRDVWRRVRFLLDQARQFADLGGGHLRPFVRWAELQRHEGSRVPEPLLPETDDDAVRIMTFHGSKGLEFPIVILSGLTTRPASARGGPQVRWHADGRPEVSLGAGRATAHFDVLNDFESEMDTDEKLRLLYVGATRARDHLLLSVHRRAKDDGHDATYASRVARVSAEHALDLVIWQPSVATEPAARPVTIRGTAGHLAARHDDAARPDADVLAEHTAWVAARQQLLEAAHGARLVWSPTAIATALAPAAAEVRLSDPPGDRGAAVDDAAPEHDAADDGSPLGVPVARGGTAFGLAVHAVLQQAVPASGTTPGLSDAAFDALVARATADAVLAANDAPAVAAAARHVLNAPTVRAAFASPHWRELAVCAHVGPGRPLIEGFVDLLADIDGELVLLDYKTDRAEPHELDAQVARYAPQLAAYALAIESATGRAVAQAVLVFTTPAAAIERIVPDLAGAKARVAAFLTPRS